MKTYNQVIEYLFKQYPIYQNKGIKAYKPDLSNITNLCEIVGNPQKNIKSIHVAGTNGKGSVCNFLSNLYIHSDYKVGLFTSPHLIDFRERITVNQELIPKAFVIDFYHTYFEAFKAILPSFFEWNTVLAFKYFEDQKTTINIIETGLGGRLDSTNIINPELSIITTVGKDHQNILGNTLHEIAKEKAGIIKYSTPTLLGPNIKETKDVFETVAAENNSKLYQAIEDETKTKNLADYQLNNWQTAYKATQILKEEFPVKVNKEDISKYLTIKGRWQILSKCPKVVADIGHNAQGMAAIKEQIGKENFEKLYILVGFSKDKNLEEILHYLPNAEFIYVTKSSNERSLASKEIGKLIKRGDCICIDNYKAAFKELMDRVNNKDLVLITGSAFLVGDILSDFF
jgi:dihydrofolate synthase/folylpolyglutamate synthase